MLLEIGVQLLEHVCGDLATALRRARAQALADGAEGAVVLLSPACASFDQFTNFEERGNAFRALVEALPGRRNPGAGRAIEAAS